MQKSDSRTGCHGNEMAAATATAGTHDAWWCWKTFPIIRQSEQMALPDTESAINLADRTR